MNRRGLLKFFGIGATVVPIIDGMPKVEAAANLIEVPTIKPLEVAKSLPDANAAAFLGREVECTVFLKDKKTGQTVTLNCSMFTSTCKVDIVDVTTHSASPDWRTKVAGSLFETEWEFKGRQVGPPPSMILR